MPPEIKTERSVMLDGAIALIEEEGADALSARNLAKRLGISTQPVYREFGDMNGVKQAALGHGLKIFAEYLAGEALDQSVRYVRFASEHPRLFSIIFRGKQIECDGLDELSHRLMEGTDIVDKLQEITGLSREKVYRVHLFVWMAIHGLAVLASENGITVGMGELEQFTKDITRGMSALYGGGVR